MPIIENSWMWAFALALDALANCMQILILPNI